MSEQELINEVIVDDSGASAAYANFCRVTATPEEVILDFGLNPQPFAAGMHEVKANHRIVMNFFTAKRLLMALGMTVHRQEQTFGAIEVDISRRVSGKVPSSHTTIPNVQPNQAEVIKLDH